MRNLKKSFILALFLFIFCESRQDSISRITFRIRSNNVPANEHIYLSGNDVKFGNWRAGAIRLKKVESGVWEKSFTFRKGTALEYKFNRGSWRSETVDSSGMEFPNLKLTVEKDTTVEYQLNYWRDLNPRPTLLTLERLQNKSGNFDLYDNWKFHSGDDTAWANPDFDDSSWPTVNPLLPKDDLPEQWQGIGWFRLHLHVDSTIFHLPLALLIDQAGASEVYLDGKLLYTFGSVGRSPETEKCSLDRDPQHIQLGNKKHLLAIRYSNFHYKFFHDLNQGAGYTLMLGSLNQYIKNRTAIIRTLSIYQILFSALPLAFAIIHFLLFIFYPQNKENLFYAIAMAGFAVICFFSFNSQFVRSQADAILGFRISNSGAIIALVFGILTGYASGYKSVPKKSLFFITGGFLLLLTIWTPLVIRQYMPLIFYIFAATVGLEILRISIKNAKKKSKRWVSGIGLSAVFAGFAYQVLIDVGILLPIGGVTIVYVYGILILAITMSIELSRSFAQTNKDLQQQLAQIKELSNKAIEQERIANEKELSRRLMEADNARKTKELEEARKLQHAMLPKNIPQLHHLDIAAFMSPATEVGGDYYDFHVAKDGTLTIAIGDATGHGMKAGTMVASIKSLFAAFAGVLDIPQFFRRCTEILKDMHLGNLFMAMMMLKIKDNELTAASAGMPPILIYRHEKNTVEEVVLKGMPLGAHLDFCYEQQTIRLAPGDTILLMSDGFPELFNQKKEIFDYARTKSHFALVADKHPDEIITQLTQMCDSWRKGNPPNDDITFIAIKMKNGKSE